MTVNNTIDDELPVTNSASPYLFADYYDVNKCYLLEKVDSKDFVCIDSNLSAKDPRLAGQATIMPDGKLIAVYSLHKQKHEDCYVPKFSLSCFLRVDTKIFDLHDKNIKLSWSNGLIKRKLQIFHHEKIVWSFSYFRPWYYELFFGTSDQNLHGVYDFFSYAFWASRRHLEK